MTDYARVSLADDISVVRCEMADGQEMEHRFTEPFDIDDPSFVTIQTEGTRQIYANDVLHHIKQPGHCSLTSQGIENYTKDDAVHLSRAVGKSVHWCLSGSGIRDFVVSKVDGMRDETIDFDTGDQMFVCGGSFDADRTKIGEAQHVTFSQPRTLTVKSDRALAFRLVPR